MEYSESVWGEVGQLTTRWPMTKAKELPSQAELRRMFDYNPETGDLIHQQREDRDARWNTRYAGTVAGHKSKSNGYCSVYLDGENYQAHRLVWMLAYGVLPNDLMIDHIDGDGFNNRLDNLRLCTNSQNQFNRDSNTSKKLPKGVYRWRRKFKAEITIDGIRKYLGLFKTPEQASEAYQLAAQEFHGEFAR